MAARDVNLFDRDLGGQSLRLRIWQSMFSTAFFAVNYLPIRPLAVHYPLATAAICG
jgi:hypothetical protein